MTAPACFHPGGNAAIPWVALARLCARQCAARVSVLRWPNGGKVLTIVVNVAPEVLVWAAMDVRFTECGFWRAAGLVYTVGTNEAGAELLRLPGVNRITELIEDCGAQWPDLADV